MGTVHVVGAGLAGIACALQITRKGRPVTLYEATNMPGGRCRSFFDSTLERWIDNGSHLVLGGNRATFDYLARIGAENNLISPAGCTFPFADISSGERWTLAPNLGPIPWWLFSDRRRVPDSRLGDYLGAWRLARAKPEQTVADCLDPGGVLFERFWAPLTIAALNTPPREAAATLLWSVVATTFARGANRCRPFVARNGLSESFITPAVATLLAMGCEIHFGHRLRAVFEESDRAGGLDFGRREVRLDENDSVVLALPPFAIAAILPSIMVPEGNRAIVNVHLRLDRAPELPGSSVFMGIVGGVGHWIFVRRDVVAVTVSAADDLADESIDEVAQQIWLDAGQALNLPHRNIPLYRVVKEKRATFTQTPESLKRRPGPRTEFSNLFLAGDWTDTGLPATIEGAIQSGFTAAKLILPGKVRRRSRNRVINRLS